MSDQLPAQVAQKGAVAPRDNSALAGLLELQANESIELPDTDYSRVIRRGLAILVLGFGGVLAWAILAPLDQGIPAPGVVAVESVRKRIDHPGGGVIERIVVKEGQIVQAGDDLIVLNETQAKSALNATVSQLNTAQAVVARLIAEREGAATINYPASLRSAAATNPDAAAVMRDQEGLLRSRRSALQGELRIINESVRGLEAQMASLAQLKAGREKQVALFNEQLGAYEKLKAQGYVSRSYLVDIERQLAEVQSRQSEDLANIANISARLSEFKMRGAQREIEYRREVETQLTDVQREAATLAERLAAQRDTVERLAIKAPVSGTVVDLAFHTVGGVIKPGDRILDIVPQNDVLVVDAQVAPQYIDRLQAGLPADVHFDAYASRTERPVLKGRVAVVSADALTDARTGTSYYSMRVTVTPEEIKRLGDLKLQPGMQASVMVKTGERTLLEYLLHPLTRRFATALSE